MRPKECALNSTGELPRHDALVPSANQFCCPGIKPSNMKDVVLFKVTGNKCGGSFKLLINLVNVEHPQSLRHVQSPQKAPNGQPYLHKSATLHSLFSQEKIICSGALFSSFFHICKTYFQSCHFRYSSTHILMFNFG